MDILWDVWKVLWSATESVLWWHRLKLKATVLKDPTAADALANLIPASKAEEALVRKAGSKVSVLCSAYSCMPPKPSLVKRMECHPRVLGSFMSAVLCCAVLCCAVLCCAVLCCAVLCCAVLCC